MNKEDIKNILSRFRHQKVEEVVEETTVSVNGREVVLSLKNVSITFNKGKRAFKAVDNVSFDIYKGEVFSLVGESGSGKTTIGKAVVRINPLSSGEIRFKGKRISGKLSGSADRDVIRNIQMIFQDPAASLNERATVDYIVSEGLFNFQLYSSEKDRVRKTEEALKSVGLLPEHLTRYPHEFSGGQRQRIGIARSIIMEPEFIVADEPISALDVSIRAQVLNLLKKFQEERGLTYLFIAHDLSVVRFISDRIAVIHKGKIVELAETEELFKHPLHPYTISLMSAIPIPDPLLEKEKQLIVYDPSQHDYNEEGPELVEIRKNHFILANSAEIATYKEKIKTLDKEAKIAAANEKKAIQAETVATSIKEEAPVMEEKPAKPKPTSKAKKVVKETSTIVVDETGKTVKPKVEKKPRTVQKKKE